MDAALDPIFLTIALVAVAAAVLAIAFVLVRRHQHRRAADALPQGAEAVLWSLTEVLPDPRNRLAIKDPTSELRLTDQERQLAAEAALHPRLNGGPRPAERARAASAKAAREAAMAKRERLAADRRVSIP
jgi:hypothetical protein